MRVLFAHPKAWEQEAIAAVVARVDAALAQYDVEVLSGKEAFDLYFGACRRDWRAWARRMGNGTSMDGSPLFDIIVVPGTSMAVGTYMIVEAAMGAGRPVLSYDEESHAFTQSRAWVDTKPNDAFFGWQLVLA